jgi:hypothetical protein
MQAGETMTSGPQQVAPWDLSDTRRRIDPWSAATAVVLLAFAALATYGVFILRGHAAAACDVLERGGGFILMVGATLLLGVNLASAAGLWAAFGSWAGLGFAGAIVVAVVLFAATSIVFLLLTGMPDGYPTPPGSCPGGEPPWWPAYLPS